MTSSVFLKTALTFQTFLKLPTIYMSLSRNHQIPNFIKLSLKVRISVKHEFKKSDNLKKYFSRNHQYECVSFLKKPTYFFDSGLHRVYHS